VFVSGSPADAPITEGITRLALSGLQRGTAADEPIVSLAGKTSVGGFAALARTAQAFVGITTGSMHVAAAVGCPTVGIFPFQSDFPERWSPLGARTAVVRASYPCHRGDTKEKCADYACIAHLDLPRILAATEALVA
jgi:ADP-heptose:LPS heptosyltransferase